MWKAIRNKQRRAYAQGLLDAVLIIEQYQGLNIGAHRNIIKVYEEVDNSYEGS